MEDEPSGAKKAAPKKKKFAPKIPPRKIPKYAEAKIEAPETEVTLNEELLKRVKEGFGRSEPKTERKSAPLQVAFGYGDATDSAKAYSLPRGPSGSCSRNHDNSGVKHKGINVSDGGGTEEMIISMDGGDGSTQKKKKEYVEPWDYYLYYPITLPLRRPYSGNPEILNKVEFGVASADFDETCINPSAELGLMEEREEAQMFFFQLPPSLPLVKRSASIKGKEVVDDSKPLPRRRDTPEKGCCLKDLPAGFMGKLQVYKSGAVKMKLGDILFNVSPGSDCLFAQDVAAINVKEKQCCILGELHKRAILTPEVDSLIDGIDKLE